MKLEGGRFSMPEFQIYGAVDISDIQHFLFPYDQTNHPVILKIKEAGITLDIKLLDHLIITEKAYFSFADEGLL